MSQQLDRQVADHSALIIDSNPASRSVLMQNLRSFGFGTVKQVSKVSDARETLERRAFDLVVCDHHFDSEGESGQELLEELRREHLLPYRTVFVMVTGEATYAKVAEAAEAALDSYLIKPFSANTLFERIKEARQRKRVLSDIFEAIEAEQLERAAVLCLQRFEKRELYWLYAARIGAELLLNLGRSVEARKLYDAVIAAKTVPWARLGVARTQVAEGDLTQAKRTLESLMGDAPQFADSYDVMGKVQMETGSLKDALETYRTAASMTPGCILRLQHCGTLSFYAGDTAVATEMLQRTWQLGRKSRLFDVLSMMLLAFLRHDAADRKGLDISYDVLATFSERHAQSVRLRRMARIGRVLVQLLAGQATAALEEARSMLGELQHPDFDMEAATNAMSLWTRLRRHGVTAEEHEQVVKPIATRFAISKAATEVLAATSRQAPDAGAWIREAHTDVMQTLQHAMNLALNGQATKAVQTLLEKGSASGNAKFIELAGAVAKRHSERIEGIDDLTSQVEALTRRFCQPTTHIAGVRRSGRSAGGLVIRR
jgi:DNA-binding response OmpR family regulator